MDSGLIILLCVYVSYGSRSSVTYSSSRERASINRARKKYDHVCPATIHKNATAQTREIMVDGLPYQVICYTPRDLASRPSLLQDISLTLSSSKVGPVETSPFLNEIFFLWPVTRRSENRHFQKIENSLLRIRTRCSLNSFCS